MNSTEGTGGWILVDGSPWAKLGVGRIQTREQLIMGCGLLHHQKG